MITLMLIYLYINIVDPNVTHTRAHSFRIIKQQCRINARLNSFACRNVNAWNSLPKNVVWCHSRATLILSASLICLIFQSFWQVWGGIRAIYGLPLPLISSLCSFYFFFTCVDFTICCWILINLIWFYYNGCPVYEMYCFSGSLPHSYLDSWMLWYVSCIFCYDKWNMIINCIRRAYIQRV